MGWIRFLIVPLLCFTSSCDKPSRTFTEKERQSAYLKLLGHWKDEGGNHFYFAPLPEGERYGRLTFIQGFQPDRIFHHRYSVLDDTPDVVTMRIFYQAGQESQNVYKISRDGYSFSKTSHFGIKGMEALDTFEETFSWVGESYGPPL